MNTKQKILKSPKISDYKNSVLVDSYGVEHFIKIVVPPCIFHNGFLITENNQSIFSENIINYTLKS